MSAMVCPRCKAGADVVALEDGVWMCTACAIEFNVDGRARGGLVRADKPLIIGDINPPPFIVYGEPIRCVFDVIGAISPHILVKVDLKISGIVIKSVSNIDELYESLKRASE